MDRRRVGLPLATLLLAGACTSSDWDGAVSGAGEGPAGATPPPAAEAEWGACDFDVPAGVEIECGTLPVPADRDDADGGTVQLAFAVVRADAEEPAEDPVVYLSGGPGQSTLELVPLAFEQLYAPLARDRDLILVDQRGTGLTQPSLACDEYSSWAEGTLGSGLEPEELEAQAVQTLEECRRRLVDDGVDLADYDSAASATDLEDLRRALGHEQWNLYGISYGTRLAQTAMRDHPDGIRSVVLDASYPIDADLYEETPGNAVRAMEALFDTCAADPACAARYPDLGPRFRSLVGELDAAPAPITLVDATTGEQIEDELDGDGLVGFLFQSLYATDMLAFLPELVAGAENGEFGTIGLLLGALTQELDLVSVGQQLAVQCQDEVVFSDREEVAAAAAADPLVQGFFEASPTVGPGIFDLCASWGTGAATPGGDEAVTSDIPALVLAGDLDPITPPRWGEDVVAELSRGHLVRFPYTGHGSLPSHDCAVQITSRFLEDPDGEPATDCVEDIGAPAFTPDGVTVEMTAFDSDELDLTGLAPEGWAEVAPGVWQESSLVSLIQQVIPGASADDVLQQLAVQLGGDEPPAPVGRLSTDDLSWDLYSFQEFGQHVELALGDSDDGLVVVQVTTSPARADVYRQQVFLPAVEALARS